MSAGNDNLTPEGPNHAAALSLLNDLMLVLDNAAKQGMERYDADGEQVYNFAYWSSECARVIGMRKIGDD
jgi:hypothetical protein